MIKTTLQNLPFPTNFLKEKPLYSLITLMERYGLEDWSVRFMRNGTYRTYGLCAHRTKQIRINRDFVKKASHEEILDLFLHEIAHAVANIRFGSRQGHNHNWKVVCVEIGAEPTRLYEGDVSLRATMQPIRRVKYHMIDTRNGRILKTYIKKPSEHVLAAQDSIYLSGDKEGSLGKIKIFAV